MIKVINVPNMAKINQKDAKILSKYKKMVYILALFGIIYFKQIVTLPTAFFDSLKTICSF